MRLLRDKISGFVNKLKEKGRKSSEGSDAIRIEGTRELVGYRLWCQPEGKGNRREKVKDFKYYPSVDEIEAVINEYGKPGLYMLQEMWIDRGLSGDRHVHQFGKVVWKDVYVYADEGGEEEEEESEEELEIVEVKGKGRKRGKKRKSELEVLAEFVDRLEEMSQTFEKLGSIGVKLARLGGKNVIELPDGKTMEDYVVDMMEQLKTKKEKLDEVFGESKVKGKEAELPIEGKVPAMMVYAPKVLEQMLDITEKKLERMGLLKSSGSGVVKEVPEFPKLKE